MPQKQKFLKRSLLNIIGNKRSTIFETTSARKIEKKSQEDVDTWMQKCSQQFKQMIPAQAEQTYLKEFWHVARVYGISREGDRCPAVELLG